MDKGKKPIVQDEEEQEEGNCLSLLDNHYHTKYIDMNLPPTPLAPPDYNIFFQGSGNSSAPNDSTKVSLISNGMDRVMTNKEDFHPKFLSMSFSPDPKLVQDYSLAPAASKGGDVLPPPVDQANNHGVVLPLAVQADHDHDRDDDTTDDDDLLLTISQRKLSGGRQPRSRRRALAPDSGDAGKVKPLVLRKPMPPEVLAEVSVIDPQRAKRIVTNRISASRAKEKKKLYVNTLEHKAETLKAKSAYLKAELTSLENESRTLRAESSALRTEMEKVVQKMHWLNSVTDHIRGEIEHIKLVHGPDIPNLEAIIGSGSNQQGVMDAPLGAAEAQHNPYDQEEQQAAEMEFRQPQLYLGLHSNSRVQEFDRRSKFQQQLPREVNPQPNDHFDDQTQPEELDEPGHHLQQP